MTAPTHRSKIPFASNEDWFNIVTQWPEARLMANLIDDGAVTKNGDTEHHNRIHRAATVCMEVTAHPWLQSCVPALIETGVYNDNPESSLHHACVKGMIGVVESLSGSLRWDGPSPTFSAPLNLMMTTGVTSFLDDEMRQGTIFVDAAKSAAGKYASRAADIEQCVLSVLDMGTKAGHSDLVFSVTKLEGGEGDRPQPVCAFVDAKFHHAIVKFLEHGFDPHSKIDGAPSLMEYADEKSPEAAHVIRSFELREQAVNVLRDIDGAKLVSKQQAP